MISAIVLTKNNEKSLAKALQSLSFFKEVIVVDTGSTDGTLQIARRFSNVKIFQMPFEGFGALRNKASTLAANDWILAIDSDEEVSVSLQKELLSTALGDEYVYSFPFVNYYNGKEIRWCGWQNETHIRLYNKKRVAFEESHVHEGLKAKNVKIMKNPIFHYSYNNLDDFLKKMMLYSSLFAEENKNKKKASIFKAVTHGVWAFFKSYFFKKGFLGGEEGFIISWYIGVNALYKYLKLLEANKKQC